MKITMPDVWDTMDSQSPGKKWDFQRYQPDVVTICLGQNDGEQDPKIFTDAYVTFIRELRHVYPKAHIVVLNSPMGDDSLKAYQQMVLAQVVEECIESGDPDVHEFIFSKRYHNGCGGHPDVDDHRQIAAELAAYVASTFNWH